MARVVITSLGFCSSLGKKEQDIIESFKRKNTSFTISKTDNSTVVCPIKDFNLKERISQLKEARYLNRAAQLSLVAAVEAVEKSGLSQSILQNTGLFVGSGPNLEVFKEKTKQAALWILEYLPNTVSSVISKKTGIHGENSTICTACSASTQAIGEAFRKIKDGYLKSALAGGGDSRLSPAGILAYKKAQALYMGKAIPSQASAPFDLDRNGFIPGEGGAFFMLEELEQAQARRADILAEIAGFGSSLDGYSLTAPNPSALQAEKAVLNALKESCLKKEDISLISAHGTSTSLNDEMEADLIARLFNKEQTRVMALKSWIGHLASACGAMELAILLICHSFNYFPAILNLKQPCSGGVNFLDKSGSLKTKNMLLQNFGFGGQNAVLIIKPWIK